MLGIVNLVNFNTPRLCSSFLGHLNLLVSLYSTTPTLHSFFSRQIVSNRYLKGHDGMVGLNYVSDQKHLTAVNSMTVVSMIYFCDITKAVKLFWQVDDLLQFQKSILRKFIEELMGKIIKKYVCENGDCSNKKIKVLPFISFITVNAIIGLTFGMFCYHIIF